MEDSCAEFKSSEAYFEYYQKVLDKSTSSSTRESKPPPVDSHLKCSWEDCHSSFDDHIGLQLHLLEKHFSVEDISCHWKSCTFPPESHDITVEELKDHLSCHAQFELHCLNSINSLYARGFCVGEVTLDCTSSKTDEDENPLFADNLEFPCYDDRLPMDALCDPSLESATLYGCRSCKCVFLTEQAFLKHIAPALINVFPPLSYNQTGYVCHWVGCNRVFTSYGSFHTHILEDHMDSTVAPFCFWRCCTNNLIILDDHVQLLRHVLLHAFIEARLHYTKRRLLTRREGWGITCSGTYGQKISVNIRTADRLLWQPDILRDGFSCRWIGCNVKSNSAQLYMEHVLEHAGSDLLETRNFVCDWNVAPLASAHSSAKPCGRSVSRLTHLRTHLYRHTGLPRFICDRCRVCFCEFDTFKEHFAWSIPNAPKRATSHEDCDTPRLKVEEECAAMNNPGEADDSILRCPGCGKAFVTKHRLLAHKRTCRCIKAGTATAPSPKRTDMVAPVDHELPPQRKGDHARVVTIDQLAGNTLPTNRPEPTDRLFCCAVPNCDFASTTQSTYMRHFKRYHTSGHPDGIWYACHICTHFHVRRAYTLSHHLRRMHGLEPQSGKMRFAYAADSEDGIYRMIGRTKPIPTSQRRLLPYPPPSSAT